MKPKNDRAQSVQPAPRKRFRIDRLEERIAPKKGGGTKNCAGGGSGGSNAASDTIGPTVSNY